MHRDFQIKWKLFQCRGLSTRSALGIRIREIQKTRHIDFLNSPRIPRSLFKESDETSLYGEERRTLIGSRMFPRLI